MTFRELVGGVTTSERRFVLCLSFVAMVLSLIAPIVGIAVASARGLHWNGVQIFAPGDFGAYLSSIAQASNGALALANMYGTEQLPATVNIFWQGIGYVAGATGLSPVFAFYAARTALIPVLALVAYAAIAHFTDDVRRRRIAFALFMFGTGLGTYVAPIFDGAEQAGGVYAWPIDLWVAESHAFLSMMYSPHFIASFAVFIATVLMLRLAWSSTGRTALVQGVFAGVLGLLLFQFHPFHAPTLYLLGGAYLAFDMIRARAIDGRWIPYAAFVLISLPSVWYHYALATASPASRALIDANMTPTPPFVHVLLGFGMIGLLAAASARREWRSGEKGRFLAFWAAIQLMLIYAPFTFQRRLIEGVSFPLCVLAAAGISALLAGRRSRAFDPIVVLAAIVLFLPSSFAAIARNVDAYVTNDPPIFFHDAEQHDVIAWIRDRSPRDAAFLSSMGSGGMIAGWGERTAYLGHWVNSGDIDGKRLDADRFFSLMTDGERAGFMREHGLTHVFVGPEDRAEGVSFKGSTSFVPVYASGLYEIHQLIP